MAADSPFFQKLPLEKLGLEYIQREILAAHSFDEGNATFLLRSINETALFSQY